MLGSYYILKGREIAECDFDEWAAWRAKHDEGRRIGATTVGPAWVSTVFLGVDHGFNGGRPVLFETMIFGGDRSDEQERYCTYDEAEAGHARIVAELQSAAPPTNQPEEGP